MAEFFDDEIMQGIRDRFIQYRNTTTDPNPMTEEEYLEDIKNYLKKIFSDLKFPVANIKTSIEIGGDY